MIDIAPEDEGQIKKLIKSIKKLNNFELPPYIEEGFSVKKIIKYIKMTKYLSLLMYMLKFCAPNSCWQGRLTSLFSQYEDISLVFMGFPENWQKCPIWQTPDEKESLKDISSI